MRLLRELSLYKLVILVLIMVGTSFARPATQPGGYKDYHDVVIDGSELAMYITNYGMFGHNPRGGSGGWWPRLRRNETYIYGAGVWVAAQKRNPINPAKWDTIVTFFYNPNSGQSEGAPALVPTWIKRDVIINEPDYRDYSRAVTDPQARVYLSNSDNAGFGWPIKEVTQSGDTVDFILSTLDSYTRYTDLNPRRQESGSKPLEILVDQWTYQFDVPGLKDITFLIWRVKNISNDTLKDVYIGACYDDDIGNEAGANANDLVGFVRSYDFGSGPVQLNLAYQFQLVPEPGWIGIDGRGTPGVIGSVFLKSPLATKEVVIIDTIGTRVGPDTVRPGEPLGMTAFKIFTLQIDPRNDVERYSIMAGWDPEAAGGRYNPYMDDVYGPGDKRFIQVSGPFDLPPDADAELVVAAVIAKDSTNIKYVAKKAWDVFTADFIAPQPPARPTLYAWGRDKEVVLMWDNTAEITRDRFYDIEYGSNPLYREYDFEGYILRRSMDGIKWDTLGRWDLPNEFTVVYTDSVRDFMGNTIYTDSIFLGTNTGLVHTYIDRDPKLRNGVRYLYEIIPYDINYSSGTWFSLSGSAGRVMVVPHKNPIDESAPEIKIEKKGLENVFKYASAYVATKNQNLLRPGKYFLRFEYAGMRNRKEDLGSNMVWPLYNVYIIAENGDTVVSVPASKILATYDTVALKATYTYIFPSDILFGGAVISEPKLEIKTDLLNSHFVADTSLFAFPNTWKLTTVGWTWDSTMNLYKRVAKSRGAFFAGSVYKLRWTYTDNGDSVTLVVIDTLTGDTIPFDPIAGRDSIATGWSFVCGAGAPSALRLKAVEKIPSNATAGLARYVMGIRLPGSDLIRFADFMTPGGIPSDGSEWIISTYVPSGAKVSRIPTNKDYYQIEVTGLETLPVTAEMLEKVKVVPNPYYVLTPLDKSKEFRTGGVRFINLPKNATIRIYNPAGDLIKVIEVTPENDGEVTWNLLTEYGIRPASGIYLYHIKTPDGKEKTGKFAVIF